MNYLEFTSYIDRTTLSSKKIYMTLVKKYGKEIIDNLYERYISDEDIENKQSDKISYYIDLQNDIEYQSKDNKMEVYDNDLFKQYLKTLSLIKRLSKEELNDLFNKYYELSNLIKEKNIKEKDIYIELNKLGFKNIGYDKAKNIENGLEYLYKIKETNEKIETLITKLELLNEQEKLYKKLIEQNLRLVVTVTNLVFIKRIGFQYESMSIMDIIQEGNIGLGLAINKYDPTKGFSFSTIAFDWIRQGIYRSMENKALIIRRPVHFTPILNKIEQTRQKLYVQLLRYPTDEEIVKEMKKEEKYSNMTVKKMQYIERSTQPIASLNKPVDGDDSDTTLVDMIEDNKNIEDIIINNDNINDIRSLFKQANLNSIQKLIIILRKGLDIKLYMDKEEFYFIFKNNCTKEEIDKKYEDMAHICNPLTLEAVSNYFNITRERIRQIENLVMRKLSSVNSANEKRKEIEKKHEYKSLYYYSVLSEKNKLKDNELKKLVEEARNILEEFHLINGRKAKLKNLVYLYGYAGEFSYKTSVIEDIIKFLEENKKNKKVIIKLKYYYEYSKIVDKLILNYYSLVVKILREQVAKRSLFNYEIENMSDFMEKMDTQLRKVIEKFMCSNEKNLESFITPYITKTAIEEVRIKRNKVKTIK